MYNTDNCDIIYYLLQYSVTLDSNVNSVLYKPHITINIITTVFHIVLYFLYSGVSK